MLFCNHKFSRILVVLLATGITISTAQADSDHGYKYGGENRGKPVPSGQANILWQKECSGCHIAYAPGLLPAESWRKVMSGLDKHFNSNASLAAQEATEITAFLVSNASNRWSALTAPLRITETAWFKRKHDGHEISPDVWKTPAVKSPANCAACHPQAERGNFNEHDVRIPN